MRPPSASDSVMQGRPLPTRVLKPMAACQKAAAQCGTRIAERLVRPRRVRLAGEVQVRVGHAECAHHRQAQRCRLAIVLVAVQEVERVDLIVHEAAHRVAAGHPALFERVVVRQPLIRPAERPWHRQLVEDPELHCAVLAQHCVLATGHRRFGFALGHEMLWPSLASKPRLDMVKRLKT